MAGLLDFSLAASDPNNPNAVTTSANSPQQRLAMALALQKQGSDYSPVQSPWQGAARMMAAALGGYQENQLNQQQTDANADRAASYAAILGSPTSDLNIPSTPGYTSPILAATDAKQDAADDGTAPASPSGGGGISGLGVGGGSPAFASMQGADPSTTALITNSAMKYGQDPATMMKIAGIESHFDPNAQNPNSSASGLFQFTKGTAAQYGVTNPLDPAQSADGAARLARDNGQALAAALDRAPTPGELYLAHQQGAGGAAKLLANPNALASALVGQQAVVQNGGSPNMTAGQFANLWTSKLDGSGPPQQQPIQVASNGGLSGLGVGGNVPPTLTPGSTVQAYTAPDGSQQKVAFGPNNQASLPLPGDAAASAPQAIAAAAPAGQQAGQAISVPGYTGSFTRAQAAAAADGDESTPGTDEWDEAAAKDANNPLQGAPLRPGSQALATPVQASPASPAPASVPGILGGAAGLSDMQKQAIITLMNDPNATPQQQQFASALFQSVAKPKDTWQTITDKVGSVWQQNSTTGERKLLQDNSPADDSYSNVTLPNGQVESFNKKTGQFGEPSGTPGGYRPMTPQEKSAYGVPADQPAYMGPDGKPSGLGGGTTVNVGADSQSYDKQLAEGLGKSHAALANGVEDGPAEDPQLVSDAILAHRSNVDAANYQPALQNAPPVDTSGVAATVGQALNDAIPGTMEHKALTNVRQMLMDQQEVPVLNASGRPILDQTGAPVTQMQPVPRDNAGQLHKLKGELDNVIQYDAPGLGVPAGALQRQQGALKMVRGQLNDALEAQVPGYANANAQSAALAKRAEAVQTGTSLLDSGKTAMTPQRLNLTYGAMDPGERAALAKGLRGEVGRVLDTKANDVVAGRNIIKGEGDWNRARLSTVFGEDPTNQVIGAVDREGQFANTANKVVENSQTAQRQAAASAMKPTPSSETPLLNPNMTISGLLSTVVKKAGVGVLNSMRADPTRAFGEVASVLTAQGGERERHINALIQALENRGQNAKTGALIGDRAALAAALLESGAYRARQSQSQ